MKPGASKMEEFRCGHGGGVSEAPSDVIASKELTTLRKMARHREATRYQRLGQLVSSLGTFRENWPDRWGGKSEQARHVALLEKAVMAADKMMRAPNAVEIGTAFNEVGTIDFNTKVSEATLLLVKAIAQELCLMFALAEAAADKLPALVRSDDENQ